jgi:2-polyprenyl-3-methyl-5-hydroxy-6-metoxy-1,4-benzoquinol methylase
MDIKESKIYQVSSYKERHPWEIARLSVINLLFKKIIKEIPAGNPTVLDFGCGDAFILQNLSKTWPDLNFLGVDSAYTLEQIQLIYNQSSLQKCCLFQNLNSISPGRAEIVLLLDVLEHADNDIDILSSVVSRLKPNGYALITVPAFQVLFCSHDRWLGHHRRYTKNHLCEISTKSGLQVRQSGYFFSGLVLPRLCHKLFESLKIVGAQKCVGIGEWSRGAFLGNFIKTLLVINAKADIGLAKHHLSLLGLSVFAICKKSLL